MPTAIDAARAALGAATTAAASSPSTKSPDINIPIDRCNPPWGDNCSSTSYPCGSSSGMKLLNFWFAAHDESDRLDLSLFIAFLRIGFVGFATLIAWMLIFAC
jgi:hypothetical protein